MIRRSILHTYGQKGATCFRPQIGSQAGIEDYRTQEDTTASSGSIGRSICGVTWSSEVAGGQSRPTQQIKAMFSINLNVIQTFLLARRLLQTPASRSCPPWSAHHTQKSCCCFRVSPSSVSTTHGDLTTDNRLRLPSVQATLPKTDT